MKNSVPRKQESLKATQDGELCVLFNFVPIRHGPVCDSESMII